MILTHLSVLMLEAGLRLRLPSTDPGADCTSGECAWRGLLRRCGDGDRRSRQSHAAGFALLDEPRRHRGKNLARPVTGDPIDLEGCRTSTAAPRTGSASRRLHHQVRQEEGVHVQGRSRANTEPFASRIYNALGCNAPAGIQPGVGEICARDHLRIQLEAAALDRTAVLGIGVYPFTVASI